MTNDRNRTFAIGGVAALALVGFAFAQPSQQTSGPGPGEIVTAGGNVVAVGGETQPLGRTGSSRVNWNTEVANALARSQAADREAGQPSPKITPDGSTPGGIIAEPGRGARFVRSEEGTQGTLASAEEETDFVFPGDEGREIDPSAIGGILVVPDGEGSYSLDFDLPGYGVRVRTTPEGEPISSSSDDLAEPAGNDGAADDSEEPLNE